MAGLWSKLSAIFYGEQSSIADESFDRNGGDSHIDDRSSAGPVVIQDTDDNEECEEDLDERSGGSGAAATSAGEVEEEDFDDQDRVYRWLTNEASDEWQRLQPKYTLVKYVRMYAMFTMII